MKMRSREEIIDEGSSKGWSWETTNTRLILEVLLDIREYLEDIRNR